MLQNFFGMHWSMLPKKYFSYKILKGERISGKLDLKIFFKF